jgi:hypothetical protein
VVHPSEDLKPQAVREARRRAFLVVGDTEVQEFCIGVTDDPVRTKEREACDEVMVLYRAKSPSEAKAVADELAKEFGTLEKCSNREGRAEESSSGRPATHVCLAVWYRESHSW